MSYYPAISFNDVIEGKVTDIYFKRTKEILEKEGLSNTRVVAEIHAYSLPQGYNWAIIAGVHDVIKLLEGKGVNVYSLPEGTLFRPIHPVINIEGIYSEFCIYETAILGILRHLSSVATKAARCKKVAGNKSILFFGTRSIHPFMAAAIDLAAFIGGCDGISDIYGAQKLKIEPTGTMPHSLIVVMGDQVKAWKAFDKLMPENVPRIALCDTWFDERVEALMAAEALGARLHGVRFDTPGSRRGNMRRIVEEARWSLNVKGYSHIKIIVSGGIDEDDIVQLRDVADGFGIGTAIAFPPSVDLSMDIVEVEGEPRSKKGKLPSKKQVYRCWNCFEDYMVLASHVMDKCPKCGFQLESMLKPMILDGRIVYEEKSPQEVRSYVLKQLSLLKEP
ncbi:MAG: nicotinate phosphoribosyltransferase [Candidatus Nezhaarchaeota archaeon]|nr:nicotinate phosphoribosyltransferase [Candidatus Nezhaarchaeota archaeon]MCX8141716.1 nicotinate phosphoribosyltransferase [Candidatus Nezhaarchaeota archaeon]MDW8049983.1 nicotinate phosphoribosyltransferase [Nitrososphaerota archaeon]